MKGEKPKFQNSKSWEGEKIKPLNRVKGRKETKWGDGEHPNREVCLETLKKENCFLPRGRGERAKALNCKRVHAGGHRRPARNGRVLDR